MIHPKQLKTYIIDPTLLLLTDWTNRPMNQASAVRLLMGTCAQETNLGYYIDQDEMQGEQKPGPAYGIMQIEYPTYRDIWKRGVIGLGIEHHVKDRYGAGVDTPYRLTEDLSLSVLIARLKYYLIPAAIPETLHDQAVFWKRYYNTAGGQGKVEEYVYNWKRYNIDQYLY